MEKRDRSKWFGGGLLITTPLVLAALSAWAYSKELVIAETHTQFLANPHSLPVAAADYSPRKLTAVEVTMRVDHQAIEPGWWGETKNLSFVPRDLIYIDGAGRKWGIYYERRKN